MGTYRHRSGFTVYPHVRLLEVPGHAFPEKPTLFSLALISVVGSIRHEDLLIAALRGAAMLAKPGINCHNASRFREGASFPAVISPPRV